VRKAIIAVDSAFARAVDLIERINVVPMDSGASNSQQMPMG